MEEVKLILKQHVDNNTVEMNKPGLCIAVRRRHLWKDSKLVLARSSNDYSMGMQVTFVSEAAVDEGGPRRENFRLVLSELARNNALFDGDCDRRVLRHNLIELGSNSFLIAGRIMALSLVYGGPAPHFLARAVAEYILAIRPYSVSVDDIPDSTVRQDVIKVIGICYCFEHLIVIHIFLQLHDVKSVEEMRDLLDGDLFDLRCTCGITGPSANFKLKDATDIIRSFCLHFVIHSAKSELDQLKEGMQTLNLLSTMQSHPQLFLPLLTISNKKGISADELISLFKVKQWSPEGSNDRESEEAVIFNWQYYIRETAGKAFAMKLGIIMLLLL